MYLGIPEVISLGRTLTTGDAHKKDIEFFEKKIRDINLAKKFLIINLFLLTLHLMLHSIGCFIFVEIHTIFSLIFGFVFYWSIQQLPNLEFLRVVSTRESS